MKIQFTTSKGNELLETLRSEGWKIKSQYSPLAFDKGIDYDRYELVLYEHKLLLEWNNWFEWELTGADDLLLKLQTRFGSELSQG
ncbi:hypothetical protein NJR55_08195 [Idiomarina sp. M1R2S28]|uniref:Uncharacterized protein n=1 Tax=Idiomarina rhizosphaerae TaxID=2961572 RepID=A0A9X2G1N3_9GAMM|nr:hypothetical protein [Idiomarina rhizosphaerae]MCP1339576.1 hypothetical protein [Idiomarina rhizosphaerae]